MELLKPSGLVSQSVRPYVCSVCYVDPRTAVCEEKLTGEIGWGLGLTGGGASIKAVINKL